MLFFGMVIGRRNPAHPINQLVSRRAGLDEFVRFHGA